MPEVSYIGQSGKVLRFRDAPQVYPVNEYQSLVLAAMSEIGATALALRQAKKLEELSAWEPCCGGGPVANALKALGLGYVQASDVNSAALKACAANASFNDLKIDSIVTADVLNDGGDRKFDLICCNPPCGVEAVIGETVADDQKRSVIGGLDGMEFSIELLEQAPARLQAGGSLVLIIVSTGNIARLRQALNQQYPRRWRVLSPTPVAAPWRREDDPAAKSIASVQDFRPFVWTRKDGWVWRLSWVIEASMDRIFTAEAEPGIPFRPFGLESAQDDALMEQLRVMESCA